ncbi:MAG: hypothetical protein LBP26_03215 [Clostridiales bacterium]|jgi:hypothetical protein|nr:hypothetical protein [Clostridiales bacterium]
MNFDSQTDAWLNDLKASHGVTVRSVDFADMLGMYKERFGSDADILRATE